MPFLTDTAYAAKVGKFYGKYISTFRSETGQVTALLFEQGGRLVAHVTSAPGLDLENVTDSYWNELNDYAAARGFGGRLRIIYAETTTTTTTTTTTSTTTTA